MFRFLKERYPLKIIIVLFILASQGKMAAQVYYSTRQDYLRSKSEQNNILSTYRNDYPDTNITELSNFFPRNFSGNIGLPSPSYILSYATADLGFRLFQPPINNDVFNEKDVTYYRSVGPYAALTGVAGSKQLQSFKMLFTHTYKDKINITLRFNRYTSLGYYNRQQTYTNNFFLTSNYTTRSKRSGYYFFVLNNGNKNDESGGIKDLRITDSTLHFNKNLMEPSISDANRDNRETKIMVNPWIRLNKRSDSTHRIDHYLHFKSKFGTKSYRYKDDNSVVDGFYKNFYYDTISTRDSSHVRQYVNDICYSLITQDKVFGFSAGYRNEINEVWQQGANTFYNHLFISDLVYRKPLSVNDTSKKVNRAFSNNIGFQFVFNGYNSGDFKIEDQLVLTLNEKKYREIYFKILAESRTPDRIYTDWKSNHFKWEWEEYKPQQQLQVKTGFNLNRNIGAFVFYNRIRNYFYFDEYALPGYYNGWINNVGLSVDFTKIFFKHLGISINYVHQVTSHAEYIRIPGNVVTAKLFYNANLFRNNLQLQIGSQVQQYETFMGYAYMPATQIFYFENKYSTGTYPYVDIYLNARIRPVSFFLKVENALQGLTGTSYSMVPGYYQTDSAFRFGITWMFFD